MRMTKGCPATGRSMHRFDKITHRCDCGRWQAGFAPKKGPVKPRGECQICERDQALDAAGSLGHHGYKRPGWGFISGDCTGVAHATFPATDALEGYLKALQNYIARQQNALTALTDSDKLVYVVTTRDIFGKKMTPVEVVISRGDRYTYTKDYGSLPAFDFLMGQRAGAIENDIKFAEKDRKRVEARIVKGEVLRQDLV